MGADARRVLWTVVGYGLVLAAAPLLFFAPFGTLFTVSALLGTLGIARAREGLGARRWRRVPGRIVRSERVSRRSELDAAESERAEIEYAYDVDGRAYRGGRIGALDAGADSRGAVERRLRRYPLGAAVRVYARPEDPSVALLEPGVSGAARLLMGAWVFAAVAAWQGVERGRGWVELVPVALLIALPLLSRATR